MLATGLGAFYALGKAQFSQLDIINIFILIYKCAQVYIF